MLKVTAVGHLGKDAITNLVNGKNVINFTVAHSEKFKTQTGETKEKTTWLDCAYWTDRIAIAPYLKKGTQVYIEGQPEIRTFQKSDGTTGYAFAVRVNSVQLLGSANNGDAQPKQQTAAPVAEPATVSAADLPF